MKMQTVSWEQLQLYSHLVVNTIQSHVYLAKLAQSYSYTDLQTYILKLISWENTRAGEARTQLETQMAEITDTADPALSLSARGVTII